MRHPNQPPSQLPRLTALCLSLGLMACATATENGEADPAEAASEGAEQAAENSAETTAELATTPATPVLAFETAAFSPSKPPLSADAIALARAAEESNAIMEKWSEESPAQREVERMRLLHERILELWETSQGITASLTITNPGDLPISFSLGGDAGILLLEVDGPDAVPVRWPGPVTMEFRIGEIVTLNAGESLTLDANDLRHGQRQLERWLLAQPGEYTLRARLRTIPAGDPSGQPIETNWAETTLTLPEPPPATD